MSAAQTILWVAILSIVFGAAKFLFNLLTGRMRPLQPKDNANDDPDRATFVHGNIISDLTADNSLWDANETKDCPLHQQPFNSVISIGFVKPKQELNVFAQWPTPVGTLQMVGCDRCLQQAQDLKAKRFVWKRRNYKEHPDWASSLIYPHLTGSLFAHIYSVKLRSDSTHAWRECLAPEWESLLPESSVSETNAPEDVVASLPALRNVNKVSVQEEISDKVLKKIRSQCRALAGETLLVLHFEHGSHWLAVTDKCIHVNSIGNFKSLQIERIRSVEKKCFMHQDTLTEELHLNGAGVFCGVGLNVDHLVVLVSRLAGNRQELDIQSRTWTSAKDGHTFTAKYVRPEGESVILRRDDGKLVRKAIATLVQQDAEYVESLRMQNGKLPHS